MKNPVENLILKLVKIADDRISGSLDLLFAILNAFKDELSTDIHEIDKEHIDAVCKALKILEEKQGVFIVVNKLIFDIKKLLSIPNPDLKTLLLFIDTARHYYEELSQKQVDDFLKFGIDANKILVHSNSHSVKSFLHTLKKQGLKIEKIYQTVSLPGGEGRVQAKKLRDEGFFVEVIDDEQVNEVVNAVNVAFFGADILFPTFFINKVKTNLFCEQFHAAGKPVFVIADKNKMVVDGNAEYFESSTLRVADKSGNLLFEKIPNKLVDEFLIPEDK